MFALVRPNVGNSPLCYVDLFSNEADLTHYLLGFTEKQRNGFQVIKGELLPFQAEIKYDRQSSGPDKADESPQPGDTSILDRCS